jgi:hypothetical protein
MLSTETAQSILDVMQDVAGPLRALKHPMTIDGLNADFSQMYLHGRRLSIYGGTNEIQRTMLATRVLVQPPSALNSSPRRKKTIVEEGPNFRPTLGFFDEFEYSTISHGTSGFDIGSQIIAKMLRK